MSVSTDAILVYGIPLEEDSIEEYEESGIENGPAWLVYSGKSEKGICIEYHCSDDYPMHIVAIEGTKQWAWRGNPKKIDMSKLVVDADWDAKLQAFIKKYDLKSDGEPGWWLASYWG